tara:strand:- start:62 stop:490 length:429 start_codon:yes stop_codon:yes gene_type:complete
MIKYKLICKNCDLSFDSWFSSSLEYEKLKNKNFLICHICNSKKVEKNLMAPKVLNKFSLDSNNKKNLRYNKINKKIKEYQKFIKNNFDYVGENFVYEARSIHYGKNKRKKNIFGTATQDEIKELKEEGIETETIFWTEDKNN